MQNQLDDLKQDIREINRKIDKLLASNARIEAVEERMEKELEKHEAIIVANKSALDQARGLGLFATLISIAAALFGPFHLGGGS